KSRQVSGSCPENFFEGLAWQMVLHSQSRSFSAGIHQAPTGAEGILDLHSLTCRNARCADPPEAPGGGQDLRWSVWCGSGEEFHRSANPADQGASSSSVRVFG